LRKKTRLPSPIPSTSKEIVYETPKQGFIPGIGYDDYDEVTKKEEAQTEEEIVGNLASPYMGRKRLLDTQYGICKDGEQLIIGDSRLFIDTDYNFTFKGTVFRGPGGRGLWELLTRKNVNTVVINKTDLKT